MALIESAIGILYMMFGIVSCGFLLNKIKLVKSSPAMFCLPKTDVVLNLILYGNNIILCFLTFEI